MREEGEVARGGGGAPVWISPGSIERKRALPVGSVERKGKEMCEGEWGRGKLRGTERKWKSTVSC